MRGSARQRRPLLSYQLLPRCPFHRTELQQRHLPEYRHPPFPAGAGALPASSRPPVRRSLLPSPGLPAWQPRSFPPFPAPVRTGSPAPQARGPGRRLRPPRERFHFPAQGCPRARLPPAAQHRPQAGRSVRRAYRGACRPSGGGALSGPYPLQRPPERRTGPADPRLPRQERPGPSAAGYHRWTGAGRACPGLPGGPRRGRTGRAGGHRPVWSRAGAHPGRPHRHGCLGSRARSRAGRLPRRAGSGHG